MNTLKWEVGSDHAANEGPFSNRPEKQRTTLLVENSSPDMK